MIFLFHLWCPTYSRSSKIHWYNLNEKFKLESKIVCLYLQRNLHYFDKESKLLRHKVLFVRPILEYASSVLFIYLFIYK